MANSMSSKTKVQFVQTAAESILDTQKRLSNAMETIKGVADKAQYAACDRVYNTIAELTESFGETMKADKVTLTEVMETLVKRTDVGEAFVQQAKKVKNEVESIPTLQSFDKITAERDGSETWNSSMSASLDDAIGQWSKARLDFIQGFANGFKKIEEEEFKEAVKHVCVKNEEFTNSMVKKVNTINDALAELGIAVTKLTGSVSEAASSVKIADASAIKPNLMGADV